MTLDAVIPQVWSARLLKNLNDEHVFADLLTREYEGEIKNVGDSVRIHTVGRVTINSYTKNTTTLTRERLDVAAQVLIVDQAHYFDFEIDDIDAAQQNPKLMSSFMEEAVWGFNDVIDDDIAAILAAGVATANQLTAVDDVGTGAGDSDFYEILVDLGVQLTTQNVPRQGRWVVVPPWAEGMLMKDSRFVSFGTGENLSVLKNGKIGRAAGFDIRTSNNVPLSSTTYTVLAGTKSAAAYVEQIRNMEAFRPDDSFGDAMKGLLLYGRKVLDPSRLASIDIDQA